MILTGVGVRVLRLF